MALFGIFQERYDQMPASRWGMAQGLISDPPFSGPDNRPAALAALIGQPGFDDGMCDIARRLVEQHRESGTVMLIAVMLKDQAGAPILIACLARAFSVSRAHVRIILQEAATLGLVARADGDGRYQALPLRGDAMRRFFAALFQLYIFALEQALAGGTDIAPIAAPDAR